MDRPNAQLLNLCSCETIHFRGLLTQGSWIHSLQLEEIKTGRQRAMHTTQFVSSVSRDPEPDVDCSELLNDPVSLLKLQHYFQIKHEYARTKHREF